MNVQSYALASKKPSETEKVESSSNSKDIDAKESLTEQLLSLSKGERDQILSSLFAEDLRNIAQAAEKKGYSDGFKHGSTAAQIALEDKIETQTMEQKEFNSLVRALLESIKTGTKEIVVKDEKLVFELVITALFKLLGCVIVDERNIARMLTKILSDFEADKPLKVFVSLKEFELLSSNQEFVRELSKYQGLEFASDELLTKGSFEITLSTGSVKSNLAEKFETLSNELKALIEGL